MYEISSALCLRGFCSVATVDTIVGIVCLDGFAADLTLCC